MKHSFLLGIKSQKHQFFLPYYKKYKNPKKFVNKKAKCQPWIKKNVDEKKPNSAENHIILK
jgi:hypothetical protein